MERQREAQHTAGRISKLAVLLLLLLALAWQAFAAGAPGWIDNKDELYPAAQYFSHVGEGKSKAEAELAAVTGIASVFSQSVKSTTKASKRMSEAVSSGRIATSVNSELAMSTQSKVDADNLIGIEMKDFWEDGKGSFWALAVLDKAKTSAILKQMIDKNAQEITHLVDVDPGDADYYSLDTYARFDFAQEVAEQNEGHLARLRVIDPATAKLVANSFESSRSLKSKAVQVAKMIPVYVEVAGDVDGRVKVALEGVVAGAGFRTSDVPMERYVLKASVSFDERNTGSSVQCRYSIEGGLEDTSFAEVLLPLSFTGRETSTDFSSAQNRAVRSIDSKVKKDFAASFQAFLGSIAAY